MLISGNSPWLLSEDGSRYVGIKNPDGTESEFVFVEESKQASKPAPKPPEHSGGAHGKSEVQ